MRQRVIVIVTLVVAVGLALVVAQVWDDAGPAPKDTATSDLLPAGGRLDAGGVELSGLLAKGRTGSWHARYKVTVANEQPGASQTIEVWRTAGHVRQDTLATSGEQPVHTATIVEGKDQTSCRRIGTEAWSCTRAATAGLDPDTTFSVAIGELGNRTVTPRDDAVAGNQARCFAITGDGPTGDACFTGDGIPLKITGEGVTMELTALDHDVPSKVFTPPK